jgi:hypothetical protein
MQYDNVDELIRKLSPLKKVEATKKLTEFYAMARRKVSARDFNRQYTDGSNDGGIDFFHIEDITFFIFQTKFSASPKKLSTPEILHEINKIKNTLIGENPNRRAEYFVNSLRRETENSDALLEIVFLTTCIVKQSIRDEIQEDLNEWRKDNNWKIDIDFIAIDKNALESVIYDVKHGYIPYTGKKTLKLEKGQWMESRWEETNVHSIICSARINDILGWFNSSDEIGQFLQKNVREFLGETGRVGKINKAIGKSYLSSPDWFWYKHNGVIILADSVYIDKTNLELIMRNPQVINGGQTLKALFSAYDKANREENDAKILLRIYKLPYEDSETYKRSIEIISALNSQNRIKPSDLRSTDPRQVRLEQIFEKVGNGYIYWRKRSKQAKSSRFSITMRNLAMRYYVCKKGLPHEGVRGNVEELFEEDAKYNEIFDENSINRDLCGNHVAIKYVTAWNIDQILKKVELPQRDREFSQYTKWFVLVDVYAKSFEWKKKHFSLGWRTWIEFIEFHEYEKAVMKYARRGFRIGREIIPAFEEARSFFKTKEANRRFSEAIGVREFESLMKLAHEKFERRINA